MMHVKIKRKPNPDSRGTRIRRVYFNRMFPIRQDALKVAFSVASGVFIGIWPTIGVAILLTVGFCTLMRWPKIPGVIASFVANPFTQFGFFYPAGYLIGCKILEPEKISFDFLEKIESLSFKNVVSVVSDLWQNASGHLLAFLIGITVVAAVFAFIFFWIAYGIVTYRKKKHIETKNKFVKTLMQEDSVLMDAEKTELASNDSEKVESETNGKDLKN